LIAKITAATSLPVNIMAMGEIKTSADIAHVGVSRLSYGPGPYFNATSDLKERYSAI
jgi:2-methylisocitrate lyase-like PEP mutase family enzyme